MNCPKCGNALIDGMPQCICCGAVIPNTAGAQPSAAAARPVQPGGSERWLSSLSELPRKLLRSLNEPSELLRGMVMQNDLHTPLLVIFACLLCALLCSLMMCRGAVTALIQLLSPILGTRANAITAQGVTYVASRVRWPFVLTGVLCRALWMLTHTAVYMVYICAVCRVQFTNELALDFLAVTQLITLPCDLLAAVCSLWSPLAAAAVLLVGAGVRHAQSCGMLSAITSLPDERLQSGKLACVAAAVLLAALILFLVGGGLCAPLARRVMSLAGGMGGLV